MSTPTTAFARLTDLVAAVEDPDAAPVPYDPEQVELVLVDVAEVLRRLADICPEHGSCAVCHTPMCGECAVGGPNVCGHGFPPVCESCDPSEVCGACYLDRPRGGMSRWIA